MQDLADAFLDSTWWEVVQFLSLGLGLTALLSLLLDGGGRGWAKLRIWGGLGLLAATVVFSMLFEDLLPRLQTLPDDHKLPFMLSFPGFLAATAIIVYGGWRFVRDTFRVLATGGVETGPASGKRRSRQTHVPAGVFFRAWLPGLGWLAAGFALMFLSASAYHESHFPVPWLWALFGH